jgi:hypothetical protein
MKIWRKYLDDREATAEHLKIIQNVITRMANTSFIIKGWAITVVSAILSFSVATSDGLFGLVALLPCFIFWGLDSYYLWQERLFRTLYKKIVENPELVKKFSMDTSPFKKEMDRWICTVFSITELAVYISIIVVILLLGFIS